MQRLAEDVALAEGPQLFVIEDATGSGKTDAAILLRMIEAGLGEAFCRPLTPRDLAPSIHWQANRKLLN
jgi:hypothetical protein